MFIKYRNSKKIQCRSDFKVDTVRIISNMKTLLHEMDARTEVEENKISYKQILRDERGKSEKGNTLLPLLEGEIRLNWSDMNKIRLEWEIKLDSLLFFTFLLGVISGFLSYKFLDIILIDSIIVSLAAWPFLFIIGRKWIILQIEDLIETSCIM